MYIYKQNTLTLYVQEDDFFPEAVVVLRPDDVFTTVFQFHAVDDEVVVIARVPIVKK